MAKPRDLLWWMFCGSLFWASSPLAFAAHPTIKPGQAPYDVLCDYLLPATGRLDEALADAPGYFAVPIPKRVHQIWFGDTPYRYLAKMDGWRRYCDALGYSYRLWTLADLPEIKELLSKRNYALLTDFLARNNPWSASDILRLALLDHFGGIYSDADVANPTGDDGEQVDLAAVVPMQGLVVTTETKGRTIGHTALFVCNNFMMGSPGHPMLRYWVDHFGANIKVWRSQCPLKDKFCNESPMYLTGPFYLSHTLAGVFSVLPITYTEALGMTDEVK